MIKKQFTVSGMTCSACSSRVERATAKIDGVISCSVNLISGVLKVEMETDLSNVIMDAVKKEGYGIKEGVERVDKSKREKNLKKRLTISIPLVAIIMYIAMGHMVGLPIPEFLAKPLPFALSQAVIAVVVIAVNFAYFTVGFSNLFKLKPNMDSLVALGSSVSFLYGVFAVCMIAMGKDVETYAHNLYFEGSAMIVSLITLGKFFEEKSKNKTKSAVEKLLNLAPDRAVVLVDGKEVEVDVSELKKGDIFILKDGFSIPADGEIVEGDGYADESMITGESLPIFKKVGDKAVCGTKFSGGYAKVMATSVGEDSTVYKIVKLVEEANSTKVPIAGLADKISGVFVPVVIAISLITLFVWLLVSKDFAYSFNFAVSVLVVSCPCALGLATPTALMVGTGKSAEMGILIKSGEALQKSASVDTVVLDKTGTITSGKPQIDEIVSEISNDEFLKICASLEEKSSHVLSKPILELADQKGVGRYEVLNYLAVRGKGVLGVINGEFYAFGNLTLIKENCDKNAVEKAEEIIKTASDKTTLILAKKDQILGYMSIKDKIKPSSYQAVAKLKDMGIKVVMLTGDNERSAKSVADELQIEYSAEVLPEDKHFNVQELQKQGKKVMMVGDGVNDAPALETAWVGVAIGAGTDVAIESADVVLIKNDLNDCFKAVKIGKKVMRNIKENLFWAFIYNLLLIPIACGTLSVFNVALNPMIASLAMSMSSVCVVLNALRLRLIKFDKKGEEEMFFKKKDVRVAVIDGMMCAHCQKRVEGIFAKLGISVKIDLKKKTATFDNFDVSSDEIKKAIESEGYTVISID
ncbi:MAG: heavy metal translocating P-type ATPase [Clostridia bacterium]|nr:heavy metal translocating P-type ATPase [Clostridia bacterium]